MEIHVEVTPETWQKFKMLGLEKGEDTLFAELVENAWQEAPNALKQKRGETVKTK